MNIIVPIIFGVAFAYCGIHLCILLLQEIKIYNTLKKKNIKNKEMIQKYRKKPVVVEAVQYIKGLEVPAIEFLGGKELGDCETDVAIYTMNWYDKSVSIKIKTLEGLMEVSDRDYIIKGVNGEFYPCKPDIFEKTYEKVD